MKQQFLVGAVGLARASLRLSVTEGGRVMGGLTIDNGDERDVDGCLEKNGALTLQLANASTLFGRFDGGTFAGEVVWHDPPATDTFSLAVPDNGDDRDVDGTIPGQRWHLAGSLGAFAASLDLTVKDGGFANGQLNVDGRHLAVVQGVLEGDELTLDFADRYDPTTKAVPRLVGRLDGRGFIGAFVTYDARVWSRKMVVTFQFVASADSPSPLRPMIGVDAPTRAGSGTSLG